jgi:putative acetyltransferase
MAAAIRRFQSGDVAGLAELYRDAFPDEDLLPLVRDLSALGNSVLSLVAREGDQLAGHVAFTICGIAGQDGKVALLGPLAVAPTMQRQGIGSALVREGLQSMKAEGVNQVLVLGDPAYYGRFGFESAEGIQPPYPLPEEWCGAWQSLSLIGSQPELKGTLLLPEPWMRAALWAP